MPRPEDNPIEVWESTTPSTTYLFVYDRRDDRYVNTPVSGSFGTKRIRIPRDDRIYNQERIPDENAHLDPFRNGTLRLVSGDVEDLGLAAQLTNDDLAELLQIRDVDLFRGEVERIDSELILRRLLDIAETQGAKWQIDLVQDLVRTRYPIGGTQRTARELFEEERRAILGVS